MCELQRHDPRQGPPGWLSYVSVDDPGAMCLNHQSWARLLVPPMNIPGGRICVAMDPRGATFALFAGNLDP